MECAACGHSPEMHVLIDAFHGFIECMASLDCECCEYVEPRPEPAA